MFQGHNNATWTAEPKWVKTAQIQQRSKADNPIMETEWGDKVFPWPWRMQFSVAASVVKVSLQILPCTNRWHTPTDRCRRHDKTSRRLPFCWASRRNETPQVGSSARTCSVLHGEKKQQQLKLRNICVFFEVRTLFLNIIWADFGFRGLMDWNVFFSAKELNLEN